MQERWQYTDGCAAAQMSAGGLVSALTGVQHFDTLWVGWPGAPPAAAQQLPYSSSGSPQTTAGSRELAQHSSRLVACNQMPGQLAALQPCGCRPTGRRCAGVSTDSAADQTELTECLASEDCVPVMLDAKLVDLYYNGFCNSVLWSLFHYVPLNTDSRLSETRTLEFQWNAYQAANQRCAAQTAAAWVLLPAHFLVQQQVRTPACAAGMGRAASGASSVQKHAGRSTLDLRRVSSPPCAGLRTCC